MFTVPPEDGPVEIRPDLQAAIDGSVKNFEASLRAELGMMIHAIKLDKYLANYRTEVTRLAFEVWELKP